MIFSLMILCVVFYVWLAVFCCRKARAHSDSELSSEISEYTLNFKSLVAQKESLNQEKIKIKEELFNIFTLYELTKEITKKLHHQEAFDIFLAALKEHVMFKECRLIDSDDRNLQEYQNQKQWFRFPLQSEKKVFGFLAVREMDVHGQEKFSILAHQFALALRRIQLYEQVEQIAITDGLTELFNRRYFLQRLQEEFQRSQLRKIKMSVLMIDVDYFKKINDGFGHLTGDQVLRQIAVIIKENIREIDIASRYGGEEFCILLPDTDKEGSRWAAERICSAVAKSPLRAYDTNVSVTVSIGVSTFPKDAASATDMIEHADKALYKAKELGRNRVQLYAELN